MELSGMVTSVSYQTVPPASVTALVNVIVTTENGDSLVLVRPAAQAPKVGTLITITVVVT